jgi:hypothetical protein
MPDMSRVRWSWIVVAVLAAVAVSCGEQQPTGPTITGALLAKSNGGEPTVDDTDPPGASVGTTLDVRIFGSKFDRGSKASFTIDGVPGKVNTNSMRFVSRSELVANITIDTQAETTLYDVEVMTAKGKKGVGADLFEVAMHDLFYTAIDLDAGCKSCKGEARDVSADDAPLYAVGWNAGRLDSPGHAALWVGTPAEIGTVDLTRLDQPDDYGEAFAFGINDHPPYRIVGLARRWFLQDVPVVWEGDGAGGWMQGRVLAFGGFSTGVAFDINDGGVIVGRLGSDTDTLAVMWSSPAAAPLVLDTPEGFRSGALGLNNQSNIAGWIKDASVDGSARAVLWRPDGTRCDLQPEGSDAKSLARRIDDDAGYGLVLVAGHLDSQPTIWTVDVNACSFEYVTVGVEAGQAFDVRSVVGGWEAVGVDDTSPHSNAALWNSEGYGALLSDSPGVAWAVNSHGHVVGHREKKGKRKPTLWVK